MINVEKIIPTEESKKVLSEMNDGKYILYTYRLTSTMFNEIEKVDVVFWSDGDKIVEPDMFSIDYMNRPEEVNEVADLFAKVKEVYNAG